MPNFAVSVFACYPTPPKVETKHDLFVVDLLSIDEAMAFGRRYLDFICPKSEGFRGHHVLARPMDYHLKPETEWSRRSWPSPGSY